MYRKNLGNYFRAMENMINISPVRENFYQSMSLVLEPNQFEINDSNNEISFIKLQQR